MRDSIERRLIRLEYLSTGEMTADILSKPLARISKTLMLRPILLKHSGGRLGTERIRDFYQVVAWAQSYPTASGDLVRIALNYTNLDAKA